MLKKISRLFVIKTRWEAYLIIYALALGAMDRGTHYLDRFPGWGGWMLMAACSGAVFLGERREAASDGVERRFGCFHDSLPRRASRKSL